MEQDNAIPILDNMPEDVKQIVEYLNKNNITFADYSGDDDDDDELEVDSSFYDGSYIDNDESESEDEDGEINIEEDESDAKSLSDLDSMF